MKTKPLSVAIVTLLVAGGLWLWRTNAIRKSSVDIGLKTPDGQPRPGQTRNPLAPPDPNRKFREMTPEQRVQLARRGPIGG